MARSKNTLELQVTADASQADRTIQNTANKAQRALGGSGGSGGSFLAAIGNSVGKLSSGFSTAVGSTVRILGVFGAIGGVVGTIGSTMLGAFGTAFSIVGKMVGMLASLPGTLLKYGAMLGGTIAAFGFAAHKALSPAAEMERYKTQLDVMGKGNLYGYLTGASAGKPFQMGETVNAGILMEGFKLSSKEFLADIMDASAAMKKPLEEVVRTVAYAKAGRTGEAIESAGMLGIGRDDLKELGFKFEKSGELQKNQQDKLYLGLLQIMRSRFGGMAQKMGTQTYEGAFSDLKDAIFRAFADGLNGFLPTGTAILRGLAQIVGDAGNWLASFDWKGMGEGLLKYFNDAKALARGFFSEDGLSSIKATFSTIWGLMKTSGGELGAAIKTDLLVGGAWVADKILLGMGKGLELLDSYIPSFGELMGNALIEALRTGVEVLIRTFTVSLGAVGSGIAQLFGAKPKPGEWDRYMIDSANAAKSEADKLFGGRGPSLKDILKTQIDAARANLQEQGGVSATGNLLGNLGSNVKTEIQLLIEELKAQQEKSAAVAAENKTITEERRAIELDLRKFSEKSSNQLEQIYKMMLSQVAFQEVVTP